MNEGRNNNICKGMTRPGPERRILKQEERKEKSFWLNVRVRMRGFVSYSCLENFVRKEISEFLKGKNERDIILLKLEDIGKEYFDGITNKIKNELIKRGKSEEEIEGADIEMIAAIFGVLLQKKKENIASRRGPANLIEIRRESANGTTLLRKKA